MNKEKNGMVHGHRWSNEELQEYIKMHLAGKESSELAERFGVSISAINKMALRIRKNGVMLPYKKSGHIAGRRNRSWTQEEVEYLVRRRNEGALSEEIASELDRTIYGVQGIICTLKQEGVEIGNLAKGARKLWSPERLKIATAGRGLKRIEI